MKRYRNRAIWEFEHELNMMAAAAAYSNGDRDGGRIASGGVNGRKVILGIDGGTASTVCICISVTPFDEPLPDPLPVLARSVAGCSNHNSVGGIHCFKDCLHCFLLCVLVDFVGLLCFWVFKHV